MPPAPGAGDGATTEYSPAVSSPDEDGSGVVSRGTVLSTRGGGFLEAIAIFRRSFSMGLESFLSRVKPGAMGRGTGSWLGLERMLIVSRACLVNLAVCRKEYGL